MKRSTDLSTRALAAMIAVVLVGSMLPGRWPGRVAAVPRALRPVVEKPAALAARVFQFEGAVTVSPTAALPEDVASLQAEVLRMEASLQELRYARDEYARLLEEATRIRMELDGGAWKIVQARALDLDRDADRPTATLTIGANRGVAVGDIVLAAELQLVGRVREVQRGSAKVDLLGAAEGSMRVTFKQPGGVTAGPDAAGGEEMTRWIEWDADAGEAGAFVCQDLTAGDDVRVGDRVYPRDSRWPTHARGFAVGVVASVEPDPDDPQLRLRAVIVPQLAMEGAQAVQVLVRDEDTGGGDGGGP